VNEALALLADFSMITLTRDTASIHRLVQTVARTPDPTGADLHRTEEAIRHAHTTAATALRDALPEDPIANVTGWPRWRALLPHINALTDHTHPGDDTEATDAILVSASVFLQDQGQFPQAVNYAHRSLITSTGLNGEDHPETLTSRSNLASAYHSAGDLERAIPLHEQTLTDRERVLGNDHPHTLASRNNLANAHELAGDSERAIPLYERTLADAESVLGREHTTTRIVRDNLTRARIPSEA
jgi:tetratricopeptide (TPR) repeat protein